jgi:hypothetical protein
MTEGLNPPDDRPRRRRASGDAQTDPDDSSGVTRSYSTLGAAGTTAGDTLTPIAPHSDEPATRRSPNPPTPKTFPADDPKPKNSGPLSGSNSRDQPPTWPANDPTPNPVAGGVLFGKYVVVSKLGQGGMGEVWLVRHRELEVERALKLIVSKVAVEGDTRARFRREARAMARFSHPNAVTVHDADMRPDGGAAYIVMEYVSGKSLDKVLGSGTPMPLDWTTRILDQLCDVLQVAHEHGIVHRDLKPANLMLTDSLDPGREQLKVLDFGIAKILGDANDNLTLTGLPIGTPSYMSPEQIFNETGSVDARSDLYSVGVILYQFLVGCRPFNGAFHKVTYDHRNTPPPPFAKVNPELKIPPAVERVVMHCLEKDPAKRPSSARALAEEFHSALPKPEITDGGGGPPGVSRRSWIVAASVAVPAFAVALTYVLRPARLSLQVVEDHLRIPAGASDMVTLRITRGDSAGPVTVTPDEYPGLVTVEYDPHASNDSIQRFHVTVDPNAPPGVMTTGLRFHARGGGKRAIAQIPLTVERPVYHLPSDFSPAPGARNVKVNGAVYPSQIVRMVDPERPVVFLLIRRGTEEGEPETFYIMRDKVWVSLYHHFAPSWEEKRPNAQPLWPVTDVSHVKAREFALWLGGERGRLPTVDQWDKAAGWWDREGRVGPFLEDTGQPGEIAVRLPGYYEAMPVGKATKDISPFHCNDMAGNGLEWTREPRSNGSTPLRGRRASEPSPLFYREMRPHMEAWKPDDRDLALGFRVVLELERPS